MVEEERYLQGQLPGEGWSAVETDSVKIGTPVVDVLCGILRLNPQIKFIKYFTYDIHVNSDDELIALDLKDLPVKQVNKTNLVKISDDIHYVVEAECSETGRDIEHVLGISSKVILESGEEAHIPMIDFMDKKHQASFDTKVVSNTLSFFPGYIITTDNSRHYWGRKLLTPIEWEQFMRYSKEYLGKFGQDVCPGFYDFSLKRGFSGLRIFAYPPYKKVEPHVESII